YQSAYILVFFFFQAEDGIRDGHVTGVQTCALPIYLATRCGTCQELDVRWLAAIGSRRDGSPLGRRRGCLGRSGWRGLRLGNAERSEERRVGEECRCRGGRGRGKSKGRWRGG